MTDSRSLLLVTGSRALSNSRGGTTRSMQWVCEELLKGILLKPRPSLVLAGDAEPVDRWAFRIADKATPQIPWRMFGLDGVLYHEGKPLRRWFKGPGPVQTPLVRNQAMVSAVITCRQAGWQVRALALVASWSQTRGTEHTIRLCQKAGIAVQVLQCPEQYRFEDLLDKGKTSLDKGTTSNEQTAARKVKGPNTAECRGSVGPHRGRLGLFRVS